MSCITLVWCVDKFVSFLHLFTKKTKEIIFDFSFQSEQTHLFTIPMITNNAFVKINFWSLSYMWKSSLRSSSRSSPSLCLSCPCLPCLRITQSQGPGQSRCKSLWYYYLCCQTGLSGSWRLCSVLVWLSGSCFCFINTNTHLVFQAPALVPDLFANS